MREYEIMIIAKADLQEAELSKLVTRWETIIAANGGEIIKKDVWGSRKLAYQINKQNRGNYFVYDVASTQENMRELDRILRLDENVLRGMVLKLADKVHVEERRAELKKQAEDAAKAAAEMSKDRAEADSMMARRGGRDRDGEGADKLG